MKWTIPVLLFAVLIPMNAWGQDNILTTAATNGSFKTLTNLVVAADLDEVLQSDSDFTVFAPTDEAFAKLPQETLAELTKPENRAKLAAILKYHVLNARVSIPKRNSHPAKSAQTLLGKKVSFERNGTKVRINNANITATNIKCSNGLIHVIDNVLIPPKDDNTIVGVASKAGNFKTLLAAAKAAGLVEALQGKGPLTVFAPTDKAFESLPKGTLKSLLKPENKDKLATILKYHVVPGRVTAADAAKAGSAQTLAKQSIDISIKNGMLTINQSRVIANDLEASNGLIHVIDQVLLPNAEQKKHSASAVKDDRKKMPAVATSENAKEVTLKADWRNSIDRDGIKCDKLTIRVGGGGSVKLTNVDAKQIFTSIGGGGSVSITGNAGSHKALISGGAVLRAKDLVSDETDINVNGGGVADVNALKQLKVKANAGAKVRYVPTDAEISKSINKYANFTKLAHH